MCAVAHLDFANDTLELAQWESYVAGPKKRDKRTTLRAGRQQGKSKELRHCPVNLCTNHNRNSSRSKNVCMNGCSMSDADPKPPLDPCAHVQTCANMGIRRNMH